MTGNMASFNEQESKPITVTSLLSVPSHLSDAARSRDLNSRQFSCAESANSQTYSWKESLKYKFLQKLVRKKEYIYYLVKNLKLFPLKFADPTVEEKFFAGTHNFYGWRMICLGITGFLFNVFLWGFIGPSIVHENVLNLKNKKFPVFDDSQKTCFHIMQAITCFGYMLLIITPYVPKVFRNLEYTLYGILSASTGGVGLFVMYGIDRSPRVSFDTPELLMKQLETVIIASDFKIWADGLILVTCLGLTLASDLFFPTRTRYSLIFHLYVFSICGGTFLYEKYRLGNSYQITEILILQIIIIAILVSFAYFGRYITELCERAAAYEVLESLERLEELESQLKTTKQETKVSTTIESLINILKQTQANFAGAKLGKSENFIVGEDLLKSAIQILSSTENLYTVNYGEDDGLEDLPDKNFLAYYSQQKKKMEKNYSGKFRNLRNIRNLKVGFTLPVQEEESDKNRSNKEYTNTKSLDSKSFYPQLSEELNGLVGIEWDLDILAISHKAKNTILEVGMCLLSEYVSILWISSDILISFLFGLQNLYEDNPYHNALHGAAVAHMSAALLRYIGIMQGSGLDEIDLVSVYIAALAHDVGHPGRNNGFIVNAYHDLAMMYNDKSPLENFHCYLLFKLLRDDNSNIFVNFSDEEYRQCRKNIIQIILATDMQNHFESISLFRVRRQSPEFDFLNNTGDSWQTVQMIVKSADLGHASVDWPQHNEWSARVTEEFYQQGEEELTLGLPISPLCDRSKHSEYAKSQKGFFEFIVQPLYREMEEIDPSGRISIECVRRLVYNKYRWEERIRENSIVPIPEEIQSLRTKLTNVSPELRRKRMVNSNPEEQEESTGDKGPCEEEYYGDGEKEEPTVPQTDRNLLDQAEMCDEEGFKVKPPCTMNGYDNENDASENDAYENNGDEYWKNTIEDTVENSFIEQDAEMSYNTSDRNLHLRKKETTVSVES